ncbi:MAG: putative RDD family membrane protein YckC [Myxococcota bacterium]
MRDGHGPAGHLREMRPLALALNLEGPDPDRLDRRVTDAPDAVPPFLLRGLARAIDLAVHIGVLEAAFRCSDWLPSGGLEAAFRCSDWLPSGLLVTVDASYLLAVDMSIGLSALVLYPAVAEWISGATVGKLLTGLRTVQAEPRGAPISLQAAALRNLAILVDGFLFGLVAYSAMARSELRQRVGDEWGGTLVVWKRAAQPARSALGVPIGVGAALLLVLLSYLVVP